jgi:lysine N6-hydroxylase
MGTRTPDCIDCLGVGIGPSNLSLACLLTRVKGISAHFVDQNPHLEWHAGMLLPDTFIQVSLFKDLVTLADPTSEFSFISFLSHEGRLYEFLNARFPEIHRVEFNQYLRWVCNRLDTLEFAQRVDRVTFDGEFVVESQTKRLRARNLVLGAGLTPAVPACVQPRLCKSVFHSSTFAAERAALQGRRVAIIGGGQSGAEIFLDLLGREGGQAPAHCLWISRRSNLFPLDDSPFTNELFSPAYSQYYVGLPHAVRQRLVGEQKLTSDGISMSTLQAIYRAVYVNRFLRGEPVALEIRPNRELIALSQSNSGWQLVTTQQDTGVKEVVHADVVILATGYRYEIPEFLDPLRSRLSLCGGELVLNEDFSAQWEGPAHNRIYVQNGARIQRGVADPNLSLVAWRSSNIVNSLAGARIYDVQRQNPLVDWGGPRRTAEAAADTL